jgi:hypothetical protein
MNLECSAFLAPFRGVSNVGGYVVLISNLYLLPEVECFLFVPTCFGSSWSFFSS